MMIKNDDNAVFAQKTSMYSFILYKTCWRRGVCGTLGVEGKRSLNKWDQEKIMEIY